MRKRFSFFFGFNLVLKKGLPLHIKMLNHSPEQIEKLPFGIKHMRIFSNEFSKKLKVIINKKPLQLLEGAF